MQFHKRIEEMLHPEFIRLTSFTNCSLQPIYFIVHMNTRGTIAMPLGIIYKLQLHKIQLFVIMHL